MAQKNEFHQMVIVAKGLWDDKNAEITSIKSL